MNKVIVNVENPYTIYVNYDLIHNIGTLIPPEYNSSKVAILTDDNIAKTHLNGLLVSLENAGFLPHIFIYKNGVESKSTDTCYKVLRFLTEECFTTSDLVIAFGGSTVHDMASFSCNIFRSGIDFIYIPTTSLGMIWAGIGGENRINTPLGSNAIGTIYHPKAVFCDVKLLETLSEKERKNGVAQILKYATIYDKQLFEQSLKDLNAEDTISLFTKLIRIKANLTCPNGADCANSLFLRFGCNIRSIIDSHHNNKFTYGESVAMGMAMTTKFSEMYGLSKQGTYRYLVYQLANAGFNTSCTLPTDYIVQNITQDNNFSNNTLKIALLKEIGKPFVYSIKGNMLKDFFGGTYKNK